MLARLTRIWNRYRDTDQRQLPLFPDWERVQWLLPLPSVGAAFGSTCCSRWEQRGTRRRAERTTALMEPAED